MNRYSVWQVYSAIGDVSRGVVADALGAGQGYLTLVLELPTLCLVSSAWQVC